MLKSFMKMTLFFLILVVTQASFAKEVVLLVPGFFSTFAPEYFSQDIVNAFSQKGFQVYVAKGLNPIGTIEDNGARLELIMQQIEKIENKHVAFNIVAHSAGGFYSLWVANHQKFEIKNILTVATPFKGVEFVQVWLERSWLFRALTDLAHLDGLIQLTSEGVKQFISSVRINPSTKIFSFGGFQKSGLDITDARELSIPLRVTDHYITGNSDGIVGFNSALGIGDIKTTANLPAQQFRNQNYYINLEHWEQVLDFRSFLILGIRNTNYIHNEQIRFYTGLANFILTQNVKRQ